MVIIALSLKSYTIHGQHNCHQALCEHFSLIQLFSFIFFYIFFTFRASGCFLFCCICFCQPLQLLHFFLSCLFCSPKLNKFAIILSASLYVSFDLTPFSLMPDVCMFLCVVCFLYDSVLFKSSGALKLSD